MKSMKALQQSKTSLFVSLNRLHCTKYFNKLQSHCAKYGSDRFSCNFDQSHCNEACEVLIAKLLKLGYRYLICIIYMLLLVCKIFLANNYSNWRIFW